MQEKEQRGSVRRQLKGEQIEIPYEEIPICVLVGRTVLEIGKPKDLGIIDDPEPNKLNIINSWRLSETNGTQGRIKLKDGSVVLLGTGATHGFRFSTDVSSIHVAIKSLGDKVVVKDLNSEIGTVVYIEEKSS